MDVVKGESKETELSVSKTKGKKSSERPSVEGIESDSEGSKMTGLLTQYSGQSPLVLSCYSLLLGAQGKGVLIRPRYFKLAGEVLCGLWH